MGNTVVEWRVRPKEPCEQSQSLDGVRKENVAGFVSPRRSEMGAPRCAANLFEGANQAIRVAGELNGRRVGEQLALP